ncbi:MAG: hypothetical protein VW868_08565, partial [Bacteroidota bacterium]
MKPEKKSEQKVGQAELFNTYIQDENFKNKYQALHTMVRAAGNPNRGVKDKQELRKVLFPQNILGTAQVDAEIDQLRGQIQDEIDKIWLQATGSPVGGRAINPNIMKIELCIKVCEGIRDKLKEDIGPSDKMTLYDCMEENGSFSVFTAIILLLGVAMIALSLVTFPVSIPLYIGGVASTISGLLATPIIFEDLGKDREIPNN